MLASWSMTLTINGDEQRFEAAMSLAELIEQLGMKADRVAVEVNREIVPRAQWASTTLRDGDRLEIVHFVGGGAQQRRRQIRDLAPECNGWF
jgi:thiamine biosynthesis protein ThiS